MGAVRRERAFKHGAHRQFHDWAHTYDRSLLNRFLFEPAYIALLEELARYRQERRGPIDLLDIGCGTGTFASLVSRQPWDTRVTAVDFVARMCKLAHEKLEGGPANGMRRVINADSEHLPFASGSFDVVTCSNSFHHYPHQAEVVREIRRVLRPGGRLVLIDGFRDNAIGWFVFDVVIERIEGSVHHAPWTHVRRLLTDAGFNIRRQRKINFLFPLLVSVAEAPATGVVNGGSAASSP